MIVPFANNGPAADTGMTAISTNRATATSAIVNRLVMFFFSSRNSFDL
jgi:hypothetical protein